MTSFVGRVVGATVLCGLLMFLVSARAGAAERQVRPEHQESIAVTVYNNDLAHVVDRRRVTLVEGPVELAFVEVSGRIMPETAHLTVVGDGPEVVLVEQNFAFDMLTARNLLEKSLGRTVRVIRTNPATGEETVEDAQIISTNDGVLLRIGDRIEAIQFGAGHDFPGRLVFDRLPEGLRAEPTLIVRLESAAAADASVALSYLTGGLSWTADYVATLAEDEETLALQSWATVTNTSGIGYDGAALRLVAGDVNREQQPVFAWAAMAESAAVGLAADMSAGAAFDYQVYAYDRAVTLSDNQTKQVALLSADAVPVRKTYVLAGDGGAYFGTRTAENLERPSIHLTLVNDESNGLGLPLPRGVVRVYAPAGPIGPLFVGEDSIPHTPAGEEIELVVGRAFDITVERRQTDFSDSRAAGLNKRVYESAHEIVVRNGKDKAVEVRLEEPMQGDWEILTESQPHVRQDAATAVWTVAVPAGGESVLTYRVRISLQR